MFLIFLKKEDGNIESIIENNSKKDIQSNFNIKLNYYTANNFIKYIPHE